MNAHSLPLLPTGLAVFPCKPDKSPWTTRGLYDASADPAVIKAMFAGKVGAMIGVPTGQMAGFFVLDEDVHHDGHLSLSELESRRGPLPRTPIARTPQGGRHFYFRMPDDGQDVRNSGSRIGKGLDVRGTGGYIIYPPSISPKGTYFWEISPQEADYAHAPEWLLSAIRGGKEKPSGTADESPHFDTSGRERRDAYIEKAIAAERSVLAGAVEGMRNDTLNKAAFALATIPVLSDARIESELRPIAHAIGLDSVEIDATLRSGIKGGRARPREWPPHDRQERPGLGTRQEAPASAPKPGTQDAPAPLELFWHGKDYKKPIREWLVHGTVPAKGTGLMSGQWGTAKTFAALDLSAAIMSSTTFAGREVVRQGGVLFIAAEGASEIPLRLKGLVDHKLAQLEQPPIDPDRLPFAWLGRRLITA